MGAWNVENTKQNNSKNYRIQEHQVQTVKDQKEGNNPLQLNVQ